MEKLTGIRTSKLFFFKHPFDQHSFNLQQLVLKICSNYFKFAATLFNLQQLYFICTNFTICNMSLVGHRTPSMEAHLGSRVRKTQIKLSTVIRSGLISPVESECNCCENFSKAKESQSAELSSSVFS